MAHRALRETMGAMDGRELEVIGFLACMICMCVFSMTMQIQ